MVTLCIDLGNTRMKAAVFNDDIISGEHSLHNDGADDIRELLDKYKPKRSILSSVIDHNPEIENILSGATAFHKLSHQTKLSFTTPVSKPAEIGTDRLALVAAAVHYYPGKNNLIIGMGSCITYNFVNQYDQFLGGAISPGLQMRFRAMHEFTAKLPLITETDDIGVPLIGYDTKTNMASGVIYGIISELEGSINIYAERYGNFNVLLTGGNSPYFASQLKNKIFADSNFLFKGLYALSELNNCD